MARSLCLLLIISVFLCMGEAKPRKQRPGQPQPPPTMPSNVEAICGSLTSKDLMVDMQTALNKATEYVLMQRNYKWGWDPQPFADTASAILSLQLSSDGKWYGKLPLEDLKVEDLKAQLSVKQLEVEFLAHLSHLLTGAFDRDHNDRDDNDHYENGKNHTMGKNDSMPMGHDGGMRGTMKPDIDVGGIDPDMTPPSGRGEGPAGPPGKPEGSYGEHMMNDSNSDKDMMGGMMGMMSIDQFANHILALHLTCHPANKFFGHDLVRILQHIMQNEKMMRDGNRGNMTHMPTTMPGGPRPEGPEGSGPARPGQEGPDGHGPGGPGGPGSDRPDGPGPEGRRPNGSICDMIPGGRMRRGFHYGLGLLIGCASGHEANPELIRCIIDAHNDDGLYMEEGVGGAPILLMGMRCIKDQVPMEMEKEFNTVITRISMYLLGQQMGDGSFGGNPVTSAFAIQALKAAETSPMKWNCENAVRNLLASQNEEGAFADSLGATLAIMPTIAHKSLADLKDIMPECDIPHEGDMGDGMMGDMGDGMTGGKPRPERP